MFWSALHVRGIYYVLLSQSGIYCISLKPIVASISDLIQEFERKAVTFEF